MMEEVSRSNVKLPVPGRSRSVLRKQALASWRFQPSDTAKIQDTDAAWIFQAAQRDMKMIRRALERELNSTSDDHGVLITTPDAQNAGSSTTEAVTSSVSSCDPGSPSQGAEEAEESLEVSDSMARGNRTLPVDALSRSCNNQRPLATTNNRIGKRRSRRGNKVPITIMRADPADFQAMVQQMTGFPVESSSGTASSRLKPQPKRPGRIGGDNMPSSLLALDSSSTGLPTAINGLFGTRPN